ncbi:MAG: lipopolysaccharide transport periplasmic protein LptA [Paracoccaceae bacterium]
MIRVFIPLVLGCLLALPATAQENGPFGGFKHDRTEPIDITADALEVRQAENLAIFEGGVVAGQGTLRLTAERVEVTFDPDNQTDDNSGAIKKMIARGNVFISNGSETAKGERAEYDVDGGKINMTGKVILTQGSNVISGQTLTINLNSGQGRIEGTGSGRVKSIFTPAKQD